MIYLIYLQIDDLVPRLPLGEVMRDLSSTDPTQDKLLDHADFTGPTRQHGLLL